jgi:hypothetical protein
VTDCATYVAPHHAQLGPDGGKYGPFNCTASATARVLDQGSCGAWKFTGAEVRAATNEPIPDKASPGLNLTQVDFAAQSLTHGAVNLDVRAMYSADRTIARVLAGEPAVIQFNRQSLIALGLGYGAGFGGGHAASMDGIGGLHIDDPLTKRFPVTPVQVKTILGSLIVNGHPIGIGNAYVAFGPDSITSRWVVSIHPQKGTKGWPSLRYFNTFNVKAGNWIVDTDVMRTGGFSATCTAPQTFRWQGHANQRLVQITDGKKALGKWVRAAWANRETI